MQQIKTWPDFEQVVESENGSFKCAGPVPGPVAPKMGSSFSLTLQQRIFASSYDVKAAQWFPASNTKCRRSTGD